MTRPIRRMRGFTLMETVLAVLIVGIIASVAAEVLLSGLGVYQLVVNRDNGFQTARVAMDRMVDEILLFDQFSMSWIGNDHLSFWDQDGVSTSFKLQTVSQHGRSVPCLYRGDDYLAGNMTQLDFAYYDENGSNTIWAWLVRRISIDLRVEALNNAGTIHFRTSVFPRNMMYSNFQ